MEFFKIFAVVFPIIWVTIMLFIVISIIKGVKYMSAQKRVYSNLNNKNVEDYIKCLSKVMNVTNWNELKNTVYYVNNSECISTELKEKLYKEAHRRGCHLDNIRVNKSKEELEKEKEERIRASGREGERNIAYNLKWLPSEYKVIIDNVNLNHRIESQEFDGIIIGPNGVFHIENKNEGGQHGCKIVIDSAGNWRRINYFDGKEISMLSPVTQLDRHDMVLNDILKENFKEKIYTALGIIVLSNKKTIVEGVENCAVPVIKADNIVRFITSYKASQNLTSEEINLIYNTLNNLKFKKDHSKLNEDKKMEQNYNPGEAYNNIEIKHESKGLRRIVVSAVIFIFILILGGTFVYKTSFSNKNNISNEISKNNISNEISKNNNIQNDTSKTLDANNNKNQKKDEGSVINVNASGTSFNNKLIVNVTNYKIDGNEMIVNFNVQNKFNTEIKFNLNMCVINENGKRFGVNTSKHLELRLDGKTDSNEFSFQPGDNKECTVYLKDYVESSSLTFKVNNIWSEDPRQNNKNDIEIKIK